MFRWFSLAVLIATVGVSGYFRRRARRQGETIPRRREGGLFVAGRALVAVPLFLAMITYIASPRTMAWASFAAPEWIRWAGLMIGVAAVPMVYWVLRSLGRNVSETVLTKSDHELVMSGPYQWVRHPLYTTGMALFLAMGLMQASWFVLFLTVIAILLMRLVVIPREERELLARFGDCYRIYMGRTGRLLPRMREKERLPALVILSSLAVAFPLDAEQAAGTTAAGLFYEVSGSGDPVVFIHAFSVDRRMWDPQIAAFEDRFRVIRYDLRGHGRSPASSEPYTGYEDLRTVLDALGINRAALVGLSAGAEVATNFAITYPDRVARLVLAAPGLGGYAIPALMWAQPVFEAVAAGEGERAAKLWTETPIMAMRSNLSAASRVTSLVMSNWRLWTYRRTEQPLSPPAVKRLSEITAPTLVIVGEQDLPHIREIAGVLARGITSARLITIPGAGHIVNLDAPDPFNEAAVAFLGR
jgi:3-oxoadipate enol-lactonase